MSIQYSVLVYHDEICVAILGAVDLIEALNIVKKECLMLGKNQHLEIRKEF